MKPAFSRVKLRAVSWEGDPPKPGDFLRTRSGRQYELLEVRGKVLECLVLPEGAELPPDAKLYFWWWTPRHGGRKRKSR